MEKDSSKVKEIKEVKENTSKLSPKQKEIIITIVVLVISIIVGFFIGKLLYETMNGPI